jgi:hypothetical protein
LNLIMDIIILKNTNSTKATLLSSGKNPVEIVSLQRPVGVNSAHRFFGKKFVR